MSQIRTIPTLACDAIAFKRVPPKLLREERDLARSCWWEYRGIHPVNRTIIYAHEFIRQRQLYARRWDDASKYEYRQFAGGTANDIFRELEVDDYMAAQLTDGKRKKYENRIKHRKALMTALWKGRQACDRHGISYEVWLAAVFANAAKSGWARIPMPTHAYSDKCHIWALDAQVDVLERGVPELKNPGLMAGSNAPFKEEFDQWLFELGALKRKHKELAFKRMVDLGYITREQAAQWIAQTVPESTFVDPD